MKIITARVPKTWHGLQADVATILRECGFSTEIEKKLVTARGKVKIDVYVEETVDGRKYIIACECKHWRAKVRQSSIHSFRTVLGDIGANIGYLISLAGFQSGALSASRLTNLELVTWEGFQEAFCQTWLEKHMSPMITEELDPLFRYTEPLVPNWFLQVPDHEVSALRALRNKYMGFAALVIMNFTQYASVIRENRFPELPLRKLVIRPFADIGLIPEQILDAVGYRDFLDEAMSFGKKAIEEFDAIKKRNKV